MWSSLMMPIRQEQMVYFSSVVTHSTFVEKEKSWKVYFQHVSAQRELLFNFLSSPEKSSRESLLAALTKCHEMCA